MRRRLLAGNWKMNMTATEVDHFAPAFASAAGLAGDGSAQVDVLFAVSYTLLDRAKHLFDQYRVTVAAQNCHWQESGAFTGEVSLGQLRDLGIGATLIGHSERRQMFGETDETVNEKVKAALRAQVWPIVCVGETLEEREKDQTDNVIAHQIRMAFNDVDSPKGLVLAYEPVWAIGTGKSATSSQAQQVHAFIRNEVRGIFGAEAAGAMRILYGGSAKPDNIAELIGQEDVDGALVGGASLKPDQFAQMYKLMS